MFDEMIVSGNTGAMAKTHKPWSVGVSMILEAGVLAVLLLIPLIYTQTMPTGVLNTFLVAPPPPAPPPPPQQAVVKQVATKMYQTNPMVAPTSDPEAGGNRQGRSAAVRGDVRHGGSGGAERVTCSAESGRASRLLRLHRQQRRHELRSAARCRLLRW